MRRPVSFILSIAAAALLVFCGRACFAGGGPKNVVLVINDNSSVSQAIGAYYKQHRGIPDSNVCHIQCSTAEEVSRTECETNVIGPIRSFLANHPTPSRLDYIVLTKGTPLKANYGSSYFSGPVSVASILTCVGEPSITYPPLNPLDMSTYPPLVNPYGPLPDSPPAPEQYFTHQLSFSGRSFYAVTRLDAYLASDVYRMIDDGFATQPAQGLFLIDGCDSGSFPHLTARLGQANDLLIAAGYQTYYSHDDYYARLREFIGGQSGVIGYFSWGSNEIYSDPAASFTQAKYISNQFVPGSIADTFVSFSARTFTYPPSTGQSLIADLIPQGLSGCSGYVSEPNANLATYPQVLFDRYIKGYNLAESFMAATPYLYWKAVTIGDPLMAPYASPPSVAFNSLQNGDFVHGTARVAVSATDASGIAKVEFYLNDEPVAVCASPPYEFEWDTSGCPDGSYTLEAIAYENSAVYTQSLTRVSLNVQNIPVSVERLGDLSAIPDGSLVQLTSKIVTAGDDVLIDSVYACEPDRTGGVKIVNVAGLGTGDVIDVCGEKSIVDGQVVVRAFSASVGGTALVPAPLAFVNRDIGARGTYTGPGSSGLPIGLTSTGLLIRTWGQVLQISPDAFYISDRSIRLPTGGAGRLKISIANMIDVPVAPALGSFVEVTGISTLELDGVELRPVLRLRSPSDIVYNVSFSQVTAPSGTVTPPWSLLSIPGIPVNPSASSVLQGCDLDGNLYCWDPAMQGMNIYSDFQPDAFPPLCLGTGFWLNTCEPYDLEVRVVADEPDADVWISLPSAGSALLGHPFTSPRKLEEYRVSDGCQMLSVADAVDVGWLYSSVYYWESHNGSLGYVDMAYDDSSALQPWHGYWIESRRPNLALIAPYNSN